MRLNKAKLRERRGDRLKFDMDCRLRGVKQGEFLIVRIGFWYHVMHEGRRRKLVPLRQFASFRAASRYATRPTPGGNDGNE